MAQYPQIAAGDELTADLLMSMTPRYAYKTSGTIRSATATATDDPDLTLELEANAVYFVEFFVQYSANTTNIKVGWTVPSGATGIRTLLGLGSTQTATDNVDARIGCTSFASLAAYGDASSVSNVCHFYETSIVTTTNAGTCALTWAQVASTVENTQVRAGSVMRVTRLA